ncbi:hypothetical protein K432DRAFT_464115 [Lepidopterella palustris CBS 459.81]|uniref:Uncharacterized protein n=1 Tax=Lepidopterella palustris CBS 459.81 TaxID=1314670 RepID=A0A8E2JBA8_9PEZI|nr:hypothetical protein K432DRAFT_464115 [Lepidopterella palustris CBS 459.81]
MLKSDVDLSEYVSDIVNALAAIEGVEATAHVYFTGDSEERTRTNVEALVNSVGGRRVAVSESVIRSMAYEWEGRRLPALQPGEADDYRICRSDTASSMPTSRFSQCRTYIHLRDLASSLLVQGRLRPKQQPHNLAQPIAVYLFLRRSLHLEPALPVPFPDSHASYTDLHSDCF